MKLTSFSLFVLILLCSAAPVLADTIPVANASFETSNPLNQTCGCGNFNFGPIPGWTTIGIAGSWQPNTTEFAALPNGSTVAYSNGGIIEQTLGVGLLANTNYTLSVDIGHRMDGFIANYAISLFAGGTLLDALTGTNGVIPVGTFADESFSYASGSSIPSGNLMIVLASAGPQIDFDNVRLTASPVPEPGSLALLAAGLGLTFLVLRRR